MFKIKTKREVKITHTEEDGSSFSIVMAIPAKEEMDIAGLKKHKEKFGDEGASLQLIRKSITGVENIGDEEGNPLSIKREDGSIDEEIQKFVFDAVWSVEDIRDNMLTAISGVSEKN